MDCALFSDVGAMINSIIEVSSFSLSLLFTHFFLAFSFLYFFFGAETILCLTSGEHRVLGETCLGCLDQSTSLHAM